MWIKITQSRHTWSHSRSQDEHSYLHSQLPSMQTNNSQHTSTDTEFNICKYIPNEYHHSYTLTFISIFLPCKRTSHVDTCTNPIIHFHLHQYLSVSTFLYTQVFRYWPPYTYKLSVQIIDLHSVLAITSLYPQRHIFMAIIYEQFTIYRYLASLTDKYSESLRKVIYILAWIKQISNIRASLTSQRTG